MDAMPPTSESVEAVPSAELLSSVGPFDYVLLAAGLVITALLAIGFLLLMRSMDREPK